MDNIDLLIVDDDAEYGSAMARRFSRRGYRIQIQHETIARRAYEIWQRHGCPSRTSFCDWLAAEAELRSARR